MLLDGDFGGVSVRLGSFSTVSFMPVSVEGLAIEGSLKSPNVGSLKKLVLEGVVVKGVFDTVSLQDESVKALILEGVSL